MTGQLNVVWSKIGDRPYRNSEAEEEKMDKDAYKNRAADRQKQKDAVSVAPADIKGQSSAEVIHRKEELARLNEEQLNDFKDHFDAPSSPKDGTKGSDAG